MRNMEILFVGAFYQSYLKIYGLRIRDDSDALDGGNTRKFRINDTLIVSVVKSPFEFYLR